MRLTDRAFRAVEKAAKPVVVDCTLTNCVFHEGRSPHYEGQSLCSHKHKNQFLLGVCPLYHLDWMKQTQSIKR
ncbi:MAG: hypothetical protein ACR2IE_13370 [Candidatus Sumerlaeaceae bacterium]